MLERECVGECKKVLLVTSENFGKVAGNKDGRDRMCRTCRNKRSRKYNEKYKKKINPDFELNGWNGLSELYC